MAESSLSFESSEEFRKKLITRNLPAYKVEGFYSPPEAPPQFQYNQSDYSVSDSPNDIMSNNGFSNRLYPLNTFGPEGGFNNTITFNGPPLPVKSNSGPYEPNETKLDIVNEFYIDVAYIQNIYGPEGGFDMMYDVTDVQNNNKVYLPYWEPPSFLNKVYTAYDIIQMDFTNGDVPSITDDSYLAQISAKNLNYTLKYRAALETAQSVGFKINVEGLTQPDPTEASLRANAPLTQRDYRVTTPSDTDDFLSRLNGNYLPTSPIPGDYFNDKLKTRYTTSIGQLINVFAGRSTLVGDILGPGITRYVNPSQILLSYTTDGQKSALFGNLSFNRYRPAYGNSILGGLFGNLLKTGINNVIEPFGTQLPGDFYLGSVIADPTYIESPVLQVPTNEFGRETGAIVLGPSEKGLVYEGNENNINFGLKAKSFSDGGGIDGDFIWTSPRYKDNLGFKVGVGGDPKFQDPEFNIISNDILSNESTSITFKPGSILDETQRLIDAADRVQGQARLKHVGNAMNQISKVFNDGYKEMTKGSKVIAYADNATGSEVGVEYARVFAKDTPYYTYADLQKTQGITKNNRRFNNSVLDNTYNLNIAPLKGNDSTNIIDGKVKKYMFSIENLAWRNSGRPGLTYDSLPVCERGPNGGRIMWFPPYDIKFNENSTPDFQQTNFLGRPEPIYTYKSTRRTGSLSWKILVDHPSITNLIINKVFANTTTTEKVNSILDSFFAGATKYDIYDLAIRYNTVPLDVLKAYQDILSDPRQTDEEIAKQINDSLPKDNSSGQNDNVKSNPATAEADYTKYEGLGLYYLYGKPDSAGGGYESLYSYYQSEAILPDAQTFFSSVISYNYDQVKTFLNELYSFLKDNERATVNISISGYYSANERGRSLDSDRNNNFSDFISTYSNSQNKNLKTYIDNGRLTIEKITNSDVNTPKGSSGNGGSFSCSSVESTQIYQAPGMGCRASVITKIKVTNPPPESQKPGETNPNEQTAQNPNPSPQAIKPQPGVNLQDKFKKNIGKKVLRYLLSECDYFEVIKESNPMIYDSIKEKIKFFNPAFHTMTPEGLNARLTFLNQCVRPGDTIPTLSSDGKPVKNDAINSSFGAPPILVLRIGDFYNTKIVPTNLQLSYEPLLFDLNPEGIGVQPMLANVTLSFDFIGGSGLARPIEKLQNALSFNYFANTEIYDERADSTEDTSALDKKIFDALSAQQPPVTKSDVDKPILNNGGTTIGEVTSGSTQSGSTSGTITYQKIFDEFLEYTEKYFTGTVNYAKNIIDDYNYGVWQMSSSVRLYTLGDTTPGKQAEIFGKNEDIDNSIKKLFDLVLDDIKNETNPIITYFNDKGFRNKVIKQVKRNMSDYIENYKTEFSTELFNKAQEFTQQEIDYAQIFRRLNYVNQQLDGKVLEKGDTEIYSISGTPLSAPATDPDTFAEFQTDYTQVTDDLNDFMANAMRGNSIIIDNGYKQSTGDFTSSSESSELNTPELKRMYLALSQIFLNSSKLEVFKNNVIKGDIAETNEPISLSESWDTITDEIGNKMKTENNSDKELINNFINGPEYVNYKKYTSVTKGKTRKFDFATTSANATQIQELKDIYKSVNINNDKKTFLGKIKFP